MIQANELRIGNLILFYKDVIEINYINKTHIGYGKGNFAPISFNNFEPIPLTEEWLLKFGFEVSEIFKNSYILNSVEIYIQDGLYWYDFGNDRVEVKTIHQLQNLYFALNDEELTIKKL